jgi:hypothetical protein
MKKFISFVLFDFGCWLERLGNRCRPIKIQEQIKSRQLRERVNLILAWKKV